MNATFFKVPAELHEWLEKNHDQSQELWIGFYKKGSGKTAVTYSEALDEALCFGWIDGVRKRIDDDSFMIRFTPRKPGSTWSLVNIKRAGELSELGLMQPAGLKAFQERTEKKSGIYAYEQKDEAPQLDAAYEARFKENPRAWEFFEAQAPWYRRKASWWVMSAKTEKTRESRLERLIQTSESGARI